MGDTLRSFGRQIRQAFCQGVDGAAEDGFSHPVVSDFARGRVVEGAVMGWIVRPDFVADRRVVVQAPEHVPAEVMAFAGGFRPVLAFAVGFFQSAGDPRPFAGDYAVLSGGGGRVRHCRGFLFGILGS